MDETKDRDVVKELITITPETKSFSAGGVEFFIESGISHQRHRMFTAISLEFSLGSSVGEIFTSFREIYDITNEEGCQKGRMAVIARDAMLGIDGISKRDHAALRLCALFINTKDEDRRTITEDQIKGKIQIWEDAGIDMKSFFALALGSVEGLMKSYKDISEISSHLRPSEKEPQPKKTREEMINILKKGSTVQKEKV